MTRLAMMRVAVILGVALPAAAQPPPAPAPATCEDQRDGVLAAYGSAVSEAATLRTQLRRALEERDAARAQVAAPTKPAAPTPPAPSAPQ